MLGMTLGSIKNSSYAYATGTIFLNSLPKHILNILIDVSTKMNRSQTYVPFYCKSLVLYPEVFPHLQACPRKLKYKKVNIKP